LFNSKTGGSGCQGYQEKVRKMLDTHLKTKGEFKRGEHNAVMEPQKEKGEGGA